MAHIRILVCPENAHLRFRDALSLPGSIN